MDTQADGGNNTNFLSHAIKIKQEDGTGNGVISTVTSAGRSVIDGSVLSRGNMEVDAITLELRVGGMEEGDIGLRDEKICCVCGDKALGCNFDAVSCESCKAFFRRNALKNKLGKCLFEGSCRIDVNTRRFCPYCRLKKCIDIGMRKDLILGEEEKKQRMEKVMRNRRMNTCSSIKPRGRQRCSSSSSNSSSVPTEGSAQLNKLNNQANQISLSVLPSSPPTNQDAVYILTPPFSSSSAISSLGANHGSTVLVTASNHDTLTSSQSITRLVLQAAQPIASSVTSVNVNSTDVVRTISSCADDSTTISSVAGVATGLQSASSLSGFLNGVDSLNLGLLSASALGLTSQTPDLLSAAGISRGLDGWLSGRGSGSKAELNRGKSVEYAEASSTHEVSGVGAVRRLSVEEERLVQELVQMYDLSFTVDLEPLVHLKQLDPSLSQLVNQSSMTVLRLIKFAKRLDEFAHLPQLCQIGILKGCWIHILLLRSVSVYDDARDVWVTPRGDIPTEILKNATGFVRLHDDHVRYCKSIKAIIGDDLAIVVIIVALVLFSAEGPHVVMREVVSNIQDKYIMLLKHYLEARYSYSRAADMFPQLMSKVKELKDFAEVHGKCLVDINPSEIEPIMLEILDLK